MQKIKNNNYEMYKYYSKRKIRNTLNFLIGFGLGLGFVTCIFVIANYAGF